MRSGRGRRGLGSALLKRDRLTCGSAGGCHRQTNGERRAVSHAGTGRLHRSPVQLHQLTDDAKPETQSGVTLCRRICGLTEALEYVRQEIRADATARIDDPEL